MEIIRTINEDRLQTLREKSIAGISFIDSLRVVITDEEFRTLSDEQQRELIQAWLYPDNDETDDLMQEIPTDIHYEPNHPKLAENSEIEDLTSIEFFVANVKSYHASIFGVYCSNCFESESTIAVTTNNYTMFEFCKPCYDKLKRAMIARDAKS